MIFHTSYWSYRLATKRNRELSWRKTVENRLRIKRFDDDLYGYSFYWYDYSEKAPYLFNLYQFLLWSTTYNTMIEKQLFLHEWGVWLCFLGEPNQSSDDYYKNFQLLFKLASPADLAYSWHHLSLNSLDNYLLRPTGQQNRYHPSHTASWQPTSGAELTQSNFSRLASSPSGKIPATRKVGVSCSLWDEVRRIERKSTRIWSTTYLERISPTASTSTASGSSPPRPPKLFSESKYGWIFLTTTSTCSGTSKLCSPNSFIPFTTTQNPFASSTTRQNSGNPKFDITFLVKFQGILTLIDSIHSSRNSE